MIYILCQGISKAAIIEKPAAGQEEAKQADEVSLHNNNFTKWVPFLIHDSDPLDVFTYTIQIPAAEAAAAPPVMDLSPEELLEMSKLVIADPKEGALVGPNPIIFINLMTPNPEQFNEEFGEASVCLQLNDDVHHACWPITHARMKLAELPEGTHKVGREGHTYSTDSHSNTHHHHYIFFHLHTNNHHDRSQQVYSIPKLVDLSDRQLLSFVPLLLNLILPLLQMAALS